MSELSSSAELDVLEALIGEVLDAQVEDNPAVEAVEKIATQPPSWYLRLSGEVKHNFSAELTLGQRSLHFETYFIPAPEENLEQFWRHLLVRNTKMYGMGFTVHDDGGVYIEGRLPNRLLTEPGEIDRILGSMYAYTEEMFTTAARIGFASRFE